MDYWLVMPAAGSGRRFGESTPKQYATLAGRTVIEWALAPFLADLRCRDAVVAIAADDTHWRRISQRLARPVRVIPGGADRAASVRSALTALAHDAGPQDWVLVHDAARPCIERPDIDRLLTRVAAHPAGGLLAAGVADTLKRAEGADVVAGTVPREALWRALTPQMFRYQALCEALDAARRDGRIPSDDSQALEWQGAHPLLVAGAPSNIKVTTAADLAIAASLIAARARAEGEPVA